MKKRLLTFILCAVVAASTCVGVSLNKNRDLNASFLDIKESYMTQEEMPLDNISNSVSKITEKSEMGKGLSLKEEFILTFNSFINGEYEDALEKSKLINEKITNKTDGFVKIYNSNILIQLLLANGQYDECMTVFNNMFSKINKKEKEEFLQEIIMILGRVRNTVPGNTPKLIEALEDIIETTDIADKDELTYLKIKSTLSTLYMRNGNYARALEKCYEIISQSETKELTNENEDEYKKIKYLETLAKSDLGIINGMLGNYDLAKEWFLKSIESRLDESFDPESHINSLYNLHTSYMRLGEFDSAFQLNDEINRIAEYLPEDDKEKIMNYSYTLLARYYLEKGDADKAEELIMKTKEILEAGGELFSYYYSIYEITLADIYAAQEDNYQKGEELFLEILEDGAEKYGYEESIKVLRSLIDLYMKIHDYEKVFIYSDKLIDLHNQGVDLINSDYAEYAVYKYNNQKLIVEEYDNKLREYSISLTLIMLSLISALITYLKYKELIKTSRRDVLTKSYNRRYFDIRYNSLINKKKPFALILFDIDNFKKINDEYGHAVGDAVLMGIVDHIKKRFDNKINLFRYGGEEFAILVEKTSKDKLFNKAEIIRKAIENIVWKYGFKVTVSMGAFLHDGSDSDVNIFEKADENLYISKNTGKNKVTI